jgi:hypothetical protein
MTDHQGHQTDREIAAPIITLIHGTWARGADWTQEHSFFRQRLQEKLRTPVNFRRFEWSGRNSHAQRLQAGKALGESLRKEFKATPQSTHVVIAHSHGGVVAHYALQDDQLQARIDGLICLATPFLEVRPRHLPRPLFWTVGLYLTIALLEIVAIFLHRIGATSNPHLSTDPLLLVLLLIGALAIVPPALLLVTSLLMGRDARFSLWEFLKGPRPAQSELVNALRLPVLGTKKLLIVRPRGDEASGVLISSQFSAWILSEIWRYLDAALLMVKRMARVAGIVLVIALGIWFLAFMMMGWNIGIIPKSFAGLNLLLGVGIELIGWFACFILGLILFSQFPFGFDAMCMSLELETTAEASPPGEAHVFQVSTTEPRLPNAKGLAHSRIYENEDVVDAIADWINSRRRSSS